ncbi:MAG TPA: hypothetical protein P5254_19260 [Aquihabitans sp.]|nr:hypothetical protein [Aquihabitans sp.]
MVDIGSLVVGVGLFFVFTGLVSRLALRFVFRIEWRSPLREVMRKPENTMGLGNWALARMVMPGIVIVVVGALVVVIGSIP